MRRRMGRNGLTRRRAMIRPAAPPPKNASSDSSTVQRAAVTRYRNSCGPKSRSIGTPQRGKFFVSFFQKRSKNFLSVSWNLASGGPAEGEAVGAAEEGAETQGEGEVDERHHAE